MKLTSSCSRVEWPVAFQGVGCSSQCSVIYSHASQLLIVSRRPHIPASQVYFLVYCNLLPCQPIIDREQKATHSLGQLRAAESTQNRQLIWSEYLLPPCFRKTDGDQEKRAKHVIRGLWVVQHMLGLRSGEHLTVIFGVEVIFQVMVYFIYIFDVSIKNRLLSQ